MTFTNTAAKSRHDIHVLLIGRMKKSGWQPDYTPALEFVKRSYLHTYFGYQTSTDMCDEELGLACDQLRSDTFIFFTPPIALFEAPTEKQCRQIIAVGYSIEKFYPRGFLARFLPGICHSFWTRTLAGGVVYYEFVRLDPHMNSGKYCGNVYNLTKAEADYCIKRLLKIEEKLHLGNYPRTGRMADSEMERILRTS